MKLIQKYPMNFLGRLEFELKNGKVLQDFKSLKSEYKREHDIKNISTNYSDFRQGDSGWGNIGFVLLFLFVVVSFLDLGSDTELKIALPIFLLMLVSFALVFKKDRFIGFNDKSDRLLFAVRMTKKGEEKEFIDRLKKEIENNFGKS